MAADGVGDEDPTGHAYPALQLLHTAAPPEPNRPAVHCDPTADAEPELHPKPGAALQSLHAVAPDSLNVPAEQIATGGVGDVEPAGHAYPALQLLHDIAPVVLKRPAGHRAMLSLFNAQNDPAGHANSNSQM